MHGGILSADTKPRAGVKVLKKALLKIVMPRKKQDAFRASRIRKSGRLSYRRQTEILQKGKQG